VARRVEGDLSISFDNLLLTHVTTHARNDEKSISDLSSHLSTSVGKYRESANPYRPKYAFRYRLTVKFGEISPISCDYLDRFRKPDGKGRKVRRDVTAGRRQVDTFPPVCVEPATFRARRVLEFTPLDGGQCCGPSVTRLHAHGGYTRAIGCPSSYRHIRINI